MRDIATATLRRRSPAVPASDWRRFAASRRPDSRRRLPGHRRERLHRRAPDANGSCETATPVRCLVRDEQRHVAARHSSTSSSPSATSRAPRSLRARAAGLRLRLALRRARVRLGDHRARSAQHQRRRHAQPARRLGSRLGAALHPLQQHRRVRLPRRRRGRRELTPPTGFATGTSQTKLRGRGRGPARGARARAGRRHPAPGDRLRPRLDRRRRRDRAGDPRAATCCWSTAAARSPASATSTT